MGVVAPIEDVAGRYCENCHVSQITDGYIDPVSEGVRPYALDPETAKALWAKSEELVGGGFEFGAAHHVSSASSGDRYTFHASTSRK